MEQANNDRLKLANLVADVYASNFEIHIRRRRITLVPQQGFDQANKSEYDLLEMLRPYEQELVQFLERYPEPFAQIASVLLAAILDSAERAELRDHFEAYVDFYEGKVGWDKYSAQRVAYWDLLTEARGRGYRLRADPG